MSGAIEPTINQSLVRFLEIEKTTEDQPRPFTRDSSKNEYVVGGHYGKSVNSILNKNSDILTKTFGDKIVSQMLRDAEIKKCDIVIKVATLGEGVTFHPSLPRPSRIPKKKNGEVETKEEEQKRLTREEEIERYELAEKYAKFATRATKNLDTSFISILENMLDAITYGNKIAEQTYKEEYDNIFGQKLLTLSSIRVKSRDSVRFVVNNYKKLVGFEATIINSKGQEETVILPREKFMVLTFRGKDGDPRGESILQAVYNAWWLKMQLWPEYLRWLLQCAIPSLVGYTSNESDARKVLVDVDGEIVRDTQGNPVYEADTASLLTALVQMRNATAIALPYGAKVEPIANTTSGDPFKGMRDVLNEEIEMGMLLQTLATSEGRFMSRAASQSHMSILDLFIVFIKELVAEMIQRDLLTPLFQMNFKNFDMDLLPSVSLGDSERRDWSTDAEAIAALWSSGFMGESQKAGYDMIIQGPPRDEESDMEGLARKAEQELALKAKVASSATTTPTKESTEKK